MVFTPPVENGAGDCGIRPIRVPAPQFQISRDIKLMWDSIQAVASSRFLTPIFPNLMD
jgi:hypothetical protein